jgi:hypothetical protein
MSMIDDVMDLKTCPCQKTEEGQHGLYRFEGPAPGPDEQSERIAAGLMHNMLYGQGWLIETEEDISDVCEFCAGDGYGPCGGSCDWPGCTHRCSECGGTGRKP